MFRLLSSLALVMFASLLPSLASADEYVRMQNRWKPDNWIHVENGFVQASQAQPGWWSADWVLEPAGDGRHVRFRNRWTSAYLHVEYGALQAGSIQPGWWSAMWVIESVINQNEFHRVRNRWTGAYLHVEHHQIQAGQIEPGWWSAMWRMHGL
jgi:hypothetical protein